MLDVEYHWLLIRRVKKLNIKQNSHTIELTRLIVKTGNKCHSEKQDNSVDFTERGDKQYILLYNLFSLCYIRTRYQWNKYTEKLITFKVNSANQIYDLPDGYSES